MKETPLDEQIPMKAEQTHTFHCPDCGADLQFHPAKGMLACAHCGREQAVDASEQRSVREHTDFGAESNRRKWEGSRQIACPSCGASWVVAATQAAAACPFCGRAHVSEQDADMVTPDAIIPFVIDNKEAASRFKAWLHKRRMSPRALREEAFASHWRGI
jgi:uncharacterized Zn finger protein (UPF0148 family)